MSEPQTLAQVLAGNTYPGRGIVVGLTPDGTRAALAYFIMGRSANSRNRVFAQRDGDVWTQPADPSQVQDPSLIIYRALAQAGTATVLTNGDQTDTIVAALADGGSFESALRTREYEPDAPNFTSRISALVEPRPSGLVYRLSQLRCWQATTQRFFWECEGVPGRGHLIHTYAGDGDPLPPFAGSPREVATADHQDIWTHACWEALNADNRISLLTRYIPLGGGAPVTQIINKYE